MNSSSGGSRDHPTLAYNNSKELWIGWEGDQSGKYDIYLRHFAADGTSTGPEFMVNESTAGDRRSPHLAVGAVGVDGSVAVSWTGSDEHGMGVFARIFNPDGTPATAEFQVNRHSWDDQSTGSFGGQRGTFVNQGAFIFAWRGVGAQGRGVYMTVFGRPGAAAAHLQSGLAPTPQPNR